MKHIHTFESFLSETKVNEAYEKTVAEWDATQSEIKLTGGLADACGIRCENGKLVAYCDAMRGAYTNDLGIRCDANKWEQSAPDMIEDLNMNVQSLAGIVDKPIDNATKKQVVEIIKSNL